MNTLRAISGASVHVQSRPGDPWATVNPPLVTSEAAAAARPGGPCRAGQLRIRYGSGVTKPELPWDRPGKQAVSGMAHSAAYSPDAGPHRPKLPKYRELPFDLTQSEDDETVFTATRPTTSSLVGVFAVFLLAWDLCAVQVAWTINLAGGGSTLSNNPQRSSARCASRCCP